MSEYLWSASNNAFFPVKMIESYVENGWDLSDCRDISNKLAAEFMGKPPAGKMRGIDSSGNPFWEAIPPATHEEEVTKAQALRAALLEYASALLGPLQDAVDLDMATDEEKSRYDAWRKYRVLLTRVDTSLAPDISWPEPPKD